MRTQIVLALLLLCCFSEFQNPQKRVLGTVVSGIAMSDDGSIITVTYPFRKMAEIFIKTKKEFIYAQSLIGTVRSFGVAMTSNYSIIINQGRNYLKSFKLNDDGIYQLDQTIFSLNSI